MKYTIILVMMAVFGAEGCVYNGQFQQQSQGGGYFPPRSEAVACTTAEQQMVKIAAQNYMIGMADEQNAAIADLPMAMPELQQSPTQLGHVISCDRSDVSGGWSFKLKVNGVQDGVPQVCDVTVEKTDADGVYVQQSQCQGSN